MCCSPWGHKESDTNKQSAEQNSTNLSLQGQKPKGRRSTILKPGKRRPQVEQVRKEMMKRQRNIAQMKKQGGNSQDQISKEEISNLPEREFRIMIVKIFQRLENKMERIQETQLMQSPRT